MKTECSNCAVEFEMDALAWKAEFDEEPTLCHDCLRERQTQLVIEAGEFVDEMAPKEAIMQDYLLDRDGHPNAPYEMIVVVVASAIMGRNERREKRAAWDGERLAAMKKTGPSSYFLLKSPGYARLLAQQIWAMQFVTVINTVTINGVETKVKEHKVAAVDVTFVPPPINFGKPTKVMAIVAGERPDWWKSKKSWHIHGSGVVVAENGKPGTATRFLKGLAEFADWYRQKYTAKAERPYVGIDLPLDYHTPELDEWLKAGGLEGVNASLLVRPERNAKRVYFRPEDVVAAINERPTPEQLELSSQITKIRPDNRCQHALRHGRCKNKATAFVDEAGELIDKLYCTQHKPLHMWLLRKKPEFADMPGVSDVDYGDEDFDQYMSYGRVPSMAERLYDHDASQLEDDEDLNLYLF